MHAVTLGRDFSWSGLALLGGAARPERNVKRASSFLLILKMEMYEASAKLL